MLAMRYGLILLAPSIQDQVQAARHAEARGFDSVWTTEFHNHHGFVRLALIASATERVTVGTAIAYAFMRTPLLAASAAMDVDEISGGGRATLPGGDTQNGNPCSNASPPPADRFLPGLGICRHR